MDPKTYRIWMCGLHFVRKALIAMALIGIFMSAFALYYGGLTAAEIRDCLMAGFISLFFIVFMIFVGRRMKKNDQKLHG